MTQGYSSSGLFTKHRQSTKSEFINIANEAERKINGALDEQVTRIEADLDILKCENALSDSERNPEFTNKVAEALYGSRQEIGRVYRAFQNTVDGQSPMEN